MKLSSGEPAEGISVQVMAAQDIVKTGNTQTADALTNAEGSFEILEISPGRYVVGIDLTRRMSPGSSSLRHSTLAHLIPRSRPWSS